MDFKFAAATHVGRVKPNNEDAYLNLPEFGLFVVADGMGGTAAGEVASAEAIEVIEEFVRDQTDELHDLLAQGDHWTAQAVLETAIQTACASIFDKADLGFNQSY